jgi:hypothetical protein
MAHRRVQQRRDGRPIGNRQPKKVWTFSRGFAPKATGPVGAYEDIADKIKRIEKIGMSQILFKLSPWRNPYNTFADSLQMPPIRIPPRNLAS